MTVGTVLLLNPWILTDSCGVFSENSRNKENLFDWYHSPVFVCVDVPRAAVPV